MMETHICRVHDLREADSISSRVYARQCFMHVSCLLFGRLACCSGIGSEKVRVLRPREAARAVCLCDL